MNFKYRDESESGFALLYITFLIGIFTMLVGLMGSLFVFQIRSAVKDDFSLKALFSAESGLEKAIFQWQGVTCPIATNPYITSDATDGSKFSVYTRLENVAGQNVCVFTSVGSYQNFNRTVEITYPVL